MLARVCDVCGEIINEGNYISIEEGHYIYKDSEYNRDFYECDICMPCARSYNLVQIVEIIRPLNV